jgi:hypothetical protein
MISFEFRKEKRNPLGQMTFNQTEKYTTIKPVSITLEFRNQSTKKET